MKPTAILIAAAAAAACGMIPGTGPGKVVAARAETVDSAPMNEDGVFPMPDVTGMTREEAEKSLRSKGILGSISIDETYVCDDPKVTELHICFTQPRAGTPTRAKLPVVLYPRQKGTATYEMPDVRGKTAEEARAIIMKLGQIEQRLAIEDMNVLMPDCQPKRVCRQDPAPGTMTNENQRKTLRVAPAE